MKNTTFCSKIHFITLLAVFFIFFTSFAVAQTVPLTKPKSGTPNSSTLPNIVGKYLTAEDDTAQEETGVSSETAEVVGFKALGCDVDISGDAASVTLQCKLYGRSYRNITGTTVTSSMGVEVGYPCHELRSNVTVCTNCEVTVYCEWWY